MTSPMLIFSILISPIPYPITPSTSMFSIVISPISPTPPIIILGILISPIHYSIKPPVLTFSIPAPPILYPIPNHDSHINIQYADITSPIP